MSDELEISVHLAFSKGGRSVDSDGFSAIGQLIDVSGTDYTHKNQSIGAATAEALVIGEITTCGWFIVKNLDATNYVEISRATFTSGQGTVKVLAGETHAFRLGSSTPYALANSSSVEIEYIIIEA